MRHDRPARDNGLFETISAYTIGNLRKIQQDYRAGKLDEEHAA